MSRLVVDALAARHGGTAYAAVQIARELVRGGRLDEIEVITRRGSIVDRGLRDQPGVRLVLLADVSRLELARRIGWEAARLPARLHEPGSALLSWSGMLPRRPAAPLLSYLCNPVPFADRGPGPSGRRAALRRTSAWARAVLVPSAAMAELAAPALGRRPAVVPLGVDHAVFRPAAQVGDELICVADFYPHKRHDLVLAAWAALPAPRPLLSLVGDPRVHPAHGARVARDAQALRPLGRVELSHGLSRAQLVEAYHRARVLVVASERESFCMPVAEALACGVPAVLRDSPVLRESGGAGASYVAGDDPYDWARAVAELYRDAHRRAEVREAGMRRAAEFTWQRTAAAVADSLGVPRGSAGRPQLA